MFDIEYKGGNTVVISTKKASLVADPKQSVVGLKDYKLKDAVALATETRFMNDDTSDARVVIDGPGEYEVSDFSIRGVAARRHIDAADTPMQSTMYRIEVGDARIALIGNVDFNLTDDQLEELGVIDIVIIPVGGSGYTLEAVNAAKIVRNIDAKMVIPVHYADSTLTYEVPQDDLDLFVKELGAPVEETAKFKVKSQATLPQTLTLLKLTRS